MVSGFGSVKSVSGLKTLNSKEAADLYRSSRQWVCENAADLGGVKRAGKWLFLEETIRADLCSTSKRPLNTGGSKFRPMGVSIENPLDKLIDEKLRELNAT